MPIAANKKITQEYLKSILDYNPQTGIWLWKIRAANALSKGDVAGNIQKQGYRYIKINGRSYMAARLAFVYMEGYFPENRVDHINRNRLDDRWLNLREVSSQCNARNSSLSVRNKSGIKGVFYINARRCWTAYICVSKKLIYLGNFKKKIDAAIARYEAEKKYGFKNCEKTSSAFRFLKKTGEIK